ncbi:hypothetical protein KIPB_002553, partial [Kipferlia bialata]
VVTPDLADIPWHPFLLLRCAQLLRQAADVEVLLQTLPVTGLDSSALGVSMSQIVQCVEEMKVAYAPVQRKGLSLSAPKPKAEDTTAPNLTFANVLLGMHRSLLPRVELVTLLTSPSLQHRHLDVLESESGLPVLRLAQVTTAELVLAGAFSQMGPIKETVDTANAEAEVDSRLDQCQAVMAKWTADVNVTRGGDNDFGGFRLPQGLFKTLRSIALYVQKDVGSHYAVPITTRARKVEHNVLWALHSASMLHYTQQYLKMAAVLMANNAEFDAYYVNALSKWYNIKKSNARRAKTRLLDVLLDTDLTENLQGVISSISPVIRFIQSQRFYQYYCHLHGQDGSARGEAGYNDLHDLMCVPDRASYLEPAACKAPMPHLLPFIEEGERFNPCAPLSLFNIDGYIVRNIDPKAHVDHSQAWITCDENWEITGVVSGSRNPERVEVLRLAKPVAVTRARGLIPRLVRDGIRDAMRKDSDAAINDLNVGDMDSYWNKRTYHSQFLALDAWLHETLRKCQGSLTPLVPSWPYHSIHYVGNGVALAGKRSSTEGNRIFRSEQYGEPDTWSSVGEIENYTGAHTYFFGSHGDTVITGTGDRGTPCIIRSADAGKTWTVVVDAAAASALNGGMDPGSIYSPLYVGGRWIVSFRDTLAGGHIFESLDDGVTWTSMESEGLTAGARRMILDGDDSILFAGAFYDEGETAGFFRSTDGGSTWAKSLDGENAFAGMEDLGDGVYLAGTYAGSLSIDNEVYTSTRERTNNIATVHTQTSHLLESGDMVGVYGMGDETFDARPEAAVTVLTSTSFSYSSVGPDVDTTADTTGRVLPGNTVKIFRTTDYAQTWVQVASPVVYSSLAYVREITHIGEGVVLAYIAGNENSWDDRGIRYYESLDYGVTWTPLPNQFTSDYGPLNTPNLIACGSSLYTMSRPGTTLYASGEPVNCAGRPKLHKWEIDTGVKT